MEMYRAEVLLYFNPRTPRGGATKCKKGLSDYRHFNPRTPRGGATVRIRAVPVASDISIHAPHEGVRHDYNLNIPRYVISIHAPHEGVRPIHFAMSFILELFQSTHPTRGCDIGTS